MALDVQTTMRDLKDRDWMKRAEAIRQLEVAEEDSAVGEIARVLLEDDSLYVRAAAARTLGTLGSADAVDALTRALHDESFHVRQSAMWALGEIGAAAQPALDALRPFTESSERFPQAELTVAEIADLVIGRIEGAVEQESAAQAASAEGGAQKVVLSPMDLMAAKKAGKTPEEYAAEKYGDAGAPAPAAPKKKALSPADLAKGKSADAGEEAAPAKPKAALSPADLMKAKKEGISPAELAAQKSGGEAAPAAEKKAMSPADLMKAKSGGGDAAPAGEKKAMSPADLMKAKAGGGDAAPAAEKKAMSPADLAKAKSSEEAAPAAEKAEAPASDDGGEKKAMSPAELFKKKKGDG